MGKAVRLDREGGVCVVTIDRPEVKNALDLETIETLSDVVDGLARDSALRAVVLTGSEGAFISGGDVTTFIRRPVSAALLGLECVLRSRAESRTRFT